MKTSYLVGFGILAGLVFAFPGCVKHTDIPASSASSSTDILQQDSIIITPFGPRKRSDVHLIESGYHLSFKEGHLLKVNDQNGKVEEDFGVQTVTKNITTQAEGRSGDRNVVPPQLGQGWITFAQNNTTLSVVGFTTQWTVPVPPPTNHGQLLYLFNGLQDGLTGTSHILQPVLQYGSNGAFGGNYWVIDNWYASCGTCPAMYGTPVTVNPGTVLVGNMNGAAATSGGGYNYTSSFYRILDNPPGRIQYYPTSNNVSITNVPQLIYAFETMESYRMEVATDYPDNPVNMTNIQILLPGGRRPVVATLNWIPHNVVTDVGQHTTVISGSEVDLHFH